ncbi:MAG: branched-chain amino acid ABC transporter permease [Actinomycetota bacterium]|nr:branched-chain amino acid ABC transporter permease [Actinomycetota bacterium]
MAEKVKAAGFGKAGFYLLVLAAAVLIGLPQLKIIRKGTLNVLTLALIWAIATMSLNLVLGYTGQASLAHGAFLGIGAYMFGIMTHRVGMNFWLSLLVACLMTAIIGLLIGLPSLRTKGPYFAIVTLCFNVIVFEVFKNWTWLSGGYQGQKVPRPTFLTERWARYYFALACLVLVILVVRQITKSLLGSSFIAIRSNENLAEALGIKTFSTKLFSLTISCFIVGLAGSLLALYNGFVDYTITNYLYSFYILIYLLIGGAATLSGPVVGTVGLYWLLWLIESWVGEFRYLMFGLLLIVVIIYFPRGVVGGLKQFWDWLRRQYHGRVQTEGEGA